MLVVGATAVVLYCLCGDWWWWGGSHVVLPGCLFRWGWPDGTASHLAAVRERMLGDTATLRRAGLLSA